MVASNGASLRQQRSRLSLNVVMAILLIVALAISVEAQSKDRDNPTRLTSPEASSVFGNKQEDHYYAFTAGPGELVVTVNAQRLAGNSDGFLEITVDLFDENAQEIFIGLLQSRSSDEQKIKRFTLTGKHSLVLRVKIGGIFVEKGKYRVRLSGAVDFSGTTIPTCLPKQGTLRIKMKDGSVKEIDLLKADEITVQP